MSKKGEAIRRGYAALVSMMENYDKIVALIKEKPSEGLPYRFRAGKVVKEVARRLDRVFRFHEHTRAWKYYSVRPPEDNAHEKCRREFCGWVEGYEGYLYTQEWIDFLVKELSDDGKYNRLLGCCPIGKAKERRARVAEQES